MQNRPMVKYYDPLKLAKEMEKVVTRGALRKYYRVGRPSRWYGGIADSHCCGCCLRCVFCWSGFPRDHPEAIGKFYSPEQIFDGLTECAKKYGFKRLRVTGNEPTIGKEHLLKLLELVDQTGFLFILETNGTLIGHDPDYAEQLSKFRNIHIRVSLKGTDRDEFVMLSFSSMEGFRELKIRLREVDRSLAENVEEEYVILYPPVVQRLKAIGVKPHTAFKPRVTYRSRYYSYNRSV